MRGVLNWGLKRMVVSKGKDTARGTSVKSKKTSTRKPKEPEATPAPRSESRDRHRGRA